MSFSSEVKAELAKQLDGKRHCRMAELAALTEFRADGGPALEKKELLTRRLFGAVSQEETITESSSNEKQEERATEISALISHGAEKMCCKRAYLRGAFLASGSISNPEKSYHFEIVCQSPAQAAHLQKLYKEFELDAKIVRRKKYYIVYIKEGAQIVDALNVMGAHVALMNLENVRILKEMRGSVNRIVNCETANIGKVVGAACRQIEDIRFIESRAGLATLPPALREMALLRLNYPDSSLAELGELCDPPIGKSGVNHRLRKLSETAGKLQQQ
ncbi:DNA-binding protein WhiA [Lachnospiraceae bacterium 47-T17]